MGYAISWLAVKQKEPQQILEFLNFDRTGEAEEFPESPISCVALPNGWFVVFANKFNSPIVSAKSLEALSKDCQVVSCQVEEHVMFSSASCYTHSVLAWHVEHDAQKNIYHIASSGNIPREFNEIYNAAKKEQDDHGGENSDVDYIHDVPIVLAQTVTSFRHDEDISDENPKPFEVLKSKRKGSTQTTAEKPWWKFWQ